MEKVAKIRLENLRTLIQPEKWGSVAKFAREHDLSENELRGLLSGNRNIGEKKARKLESEIGLPNGCLDIPGMETGADPAKEIEEAINRADFLSTAEKKSFIGMVHAIKARGK